MAPTKRCLVDQTKPNKKIKHSTSTLVVAAPHQTSIVPMPPTKRGPVYVASPQNEPNKRITRANSSLIVRAPHENGEHPNKLWKMPTLPEHGIVVTAHNCRDLETCLKPSGTPKKNWMELNVCSFSDRENNAPVFPEDVEFEILVRLPVQSLLRFRCVSKSWCALIRSPTFIKRHLRQQKKGSVLLIRRSFRGREKKDVFSFHNPDSPYLEKLHPNLSIPFLKDFKDPRRHGKYRPYYPEAVCVLGPCNGLVCIIHREDFILCNPSLREFKHLPECPYAPPPGYKHGWEGYGFGRASNSDLKVVLIRPIYDEEASYILIYVYNSRIGAWTKIDCDSTVMARNYYKLKFQVFLNGACHWIASNMSFSTRKFCFSDFILSFDINTEVIRRRELPDFLKNIEGSCNMLFTKPK